MRFLPTEEQTAFGRTLAELLTAARVPAVARAWAAGDPAPGRALLERLAATGLFALAVPEEHGGAGVLPVELVTAFVELGRYAVPGPVVETAAAGTLLTGAATGTGTAVGEAVGRLVAGVSSGAPVTLVLPGGSGYALDPDVSETVLVVEEAGPGSGVLRAAPGHGPLRISADPVRRRARPAAGGALLASGPGVVRAAARAGELARLLTAAQSLGVGLALLERTVAYVRQRRQFGRPVGSFQAVRHRLADVLIGLEFARPLVFGAAVTGARGDIAAAKTAAGEAAYAAARAALQAHGAIGYTEELDLALWLRKARPLRDAWGTPSVCRGVVLDAYAADRAEAPGSAG
ncbi:acyl-CoA dehydrogenase family protein [Streptomyces yaizuensis]|uniref:Acyl-CoA/acyl-ACP dehydrogenase n=1 Tax=Streptomyces yaizuensis TaxID=2989713 RepID=A0ABQ5P7E0_9ACTN|nr:acyl-CoA dehydrogenase family protein [Streptomyces sp. YSPA8]GLF98521.1 acyl-CoA/acyl-ACP dehydrogenase [Streptomyces sp. YSPA8]